MSIGAPAEMFCAVENFLGPHLENHIGMSADPRAARGYVAQHRVEQRAGLAPAERVDPDEHTIDFQELLADFVGEFFVVNRGLGMNAEP